MADVRVSIFDEAALSALLVEHGAVAVDLGRRAVRVTDAAKVIATGAPRVQTGRYRSSIAWRLGTDERGLFAEVGSNVSYARVLEEGSGPHIIRARRKKALSWPGARHPVKQVRHPGTPAFHVLAKALRAAL